MNQLPSFTSRVGALSDVPWLASGYAAEAGTTAVANNRTTTSEAKKILRFILTPPFSVLRESRGGMALSGRLTIS
jgi:hypothetical protein